MISRRKMLKSGAAMSVALGMGAQTTNVFAAITDRAQLGAKSFTPDCTKLHPRMAQRLSDLLSDPALSMPARNHALKTWHCPKCETRIGLPLAA